MPASFAGPAGPAPGPEPGPDPSAFAIALPDPVPGPEPAQPSSVSVGPSKQAIEKIRAAPLSRKPGVPRGAKIKHGLTAAEVESARQKHGWNEVLEKKSSPVMRFLMTFYGAVPFMLILTAVIAGVLQKWETMGMVVALLLANSCIGFWEESRAAAAVDALMSRLTIEPKVKREGKWVLIKGRELVPGDIVRLRAGDFVPADAIVLEDGISADESFITGESMPKSWGPGSLLLSGSQVSRGECTAVVTATGRNTAFGKTVELVASSRPQMHSEIVTGRVAFVLFVATMIVAGFVAFFVAVNHMSLIAALPNIIMLVASGMPTGLPAMFKLTMAFGSQELTKHGVLISSLEATEDAARMTVLCADKTGTLTQNKLSVEGVRPAPKLATTLLLLTNGEEKKLPSKTDATTATEGAESGGPVPVVAAPTASLLVRAPSFSPSSSSGPGSPRKGLTATGSAADLTDPASAAAQAVILFAAALASSDANADAIDTAVTAKADTHDGPGSSELKTQLFGHPLGKKAAMEAKEAGPPPGVAPPHPSGRPTSSSFEVFETAFAATGAANIAAAMPPSAPSSSPSSSSSSSQQNNQLQSHWRLIRFFPFDPSTRRTEAIVENVYTGKRLRCVKGAVKEVMALCKSSSEASFGAYGTGNNNNQSFFMPSENRRLVEEEEALERWATEAEADFASRAFRTLAVAASELVPLQAHDPLLVAPRFPGLSGPPSSSSPSPARPSTPDQQSKRQQQQDVEDATGINNSVSGTPGGGGGGGGGSSSDQDLVLPNEGKLFFLGVMGLQDPPRPDTAACVQALRELGVRTLMITGDTQKIAVEISKRVGIAGLASEMRQDQSNVVEIDCLAPHDDELAAQAAERRRKMKRKRSKSWEGRSKGGDDDGFRSGDEEEAFLPPSDEGAGLRKRKGGLASYDGEDDDDDYLGIAGKASGISSGLLAGEREPFFVKMSDLPPPIKRGAAATAARTGKGTPSPIGVAGSPAPSAASALGSAAMSVATQAKAHGGVSGGAGDSTWTGSEDLSLEPELLDAVLKADGFAGVFPNQKHKLISALQHQGVCAGMTGDGINDAPALKQAEVGVAVSNATDVAKKSARVVLTKDGLSGIIELVKVSRTIHMRVETWVINKVAKEFAVVFFIVALFFISKTWIIGAFEAAVLLISQNVVTLSLAADHASGSGHPQDWHIAPLFTVGVLVGAVSFSAGLGFFYVALHHLGYTMLDDTMRTVCFELVSFLCALNVMVVRERRWWWSSMPAWPVTVANGLGCLVVFIIATVGVPELPRIPISHSFLIILWSMVSSLLVADVCKIAFSTGCFCAARRRRLRRTAADAEEKRIMHEAQKLLLAKDGQTDAADPVLDTGRTFFGLPCKNNSRKTCQLIRSVLCCRDDDDDEELEQTGSTTNKRYSSNSSGSGSPVAKASARKASAESGVAKAATDGAAAPAVAAGSNAAAQLPSGGNAQQELETGKKTS